MSLSALEPTGLNLERADLNRTEYSKLFGSLSALLDAHFLDSLEEVILEQMVVNNDPRVIAAYDVFERMGGGSLLALSRRYRSIVRSSQHASVVTVMRHSQFTLSQALHVVSMYVSATGGSDGQPLTLPLFTRWMMEGFAYSLLGDGVSSSTVNKLRDFIDSGQMMEGVQEESSIIIKSFLYFVYGGHPSLLTAPVMVDAVHSLAVPLPTFASTLSLLTFGTFQERAVYPFFLCAPLLSSPPPLVITSKDVLTFFTAFYAFFCPFATNVNVFHQACASDSHQTSSGGSGGSGGREETAVEDSVLGRTQSTMTDLCSPEVALQSFHSLDLNADQTITFEEFWSAEKMRQFPKVFNKVLMLVSGSVTATSCDILI